MVKKLMVALVALSLLLAGCAPSPMPQAPVPLTPESVEPAALELEPAPITYSSVKLFLPIYEGLVMAPAVIPIEGLFPGALVDTWPADTEIRLYGNYFLWISEGEPFSIVIYNAEKETRYYSLTYADAPKEVNYCHYLGGEVAYAKAPNGFRDSVVLPTEPIHIEARSYLIVPISFSLPAEMEYPDDWEFRVFVVPVGKQVVYGGEVRILASMR